MPAVYPLWLKAWILELYSLDILFKHVSMEQIKIKSHCTVIWFYFYPFTSSLDIYLGPTISFQAL